jgi:hypothetical protein
VKSGNNYWGLVMMKKKTTAKKKAFTPKAACPKKAACRKAGKCLGGCSK